MGIAVRIDEYITRAWGLYVCVCIYMHQFLYIGESGNGFALLVHMHGFMAVNTA